MNRKDLDPVIGLEVHAQLKTAAKLFCGCPTDFGGKPNSQICPVCTGQPGVLPVVNEEAVRNVVMTGLSLGCEILPFSRFARKQYFYPDLPKNYQISQFDTPLCRGGAVTVQLEGGTGRSIRLTRIHLEEDAGKLLHEIGTRRIPGSLVDFNRTGIPLMEIVSEPEIHSPDEAYAYLVSLKEILEYLGVSDCNMEEGKLRCDANISMRPRGSTVLGTKTELKNMNSFKNVREGIAYEILRQKEILARGERIVQETRLWDAGRGVSEPMRTKEDSRDYRYFPDPDLAPIELLPAWIDGVRKALPVLPYARRTDFTGRYGLSIYDAGVLTAKKAPADYFEGAVAAVRKGREQKDDIRETAKLVSNWMTTELFGRLNAEGITIEASPVHAKDLGVLVGMIQRSVISGKIGKQVFEEMFTRRVEPESFVRENGLAQIADEKLLDRIIVEVIAENQKAVAEYRGGKKQAIGSLVGRVMKKTNGKANPPLVNRILKKKLDDMEC